MILNHMMILNLNFHKNVVENIENINFWKEKNSGAFCVRVWDANLRLGTTHWQFFF